jgi:peptide/nickel transport system permease protein
MAYLVRHAVWGALIVGAVATLTFVLVTASPGRYFDEARLSPAVDARQLERLRASRGLDIPLLPAYFAWARQLVRARLGRSIVYDAPVSILVWPRAVNTVWLSAIATVCGWLAALPIGIWSAACGARWPDRIVGAACRTVVAVPDPLLVLGTLWVCTTLGWAPAFHLIGPVFAIVLLMAPPLTLQIRSAMLGQSRAPYLVAARARGVSGLRLYAVHALKASVPTLAPLLAITAASVLSGSLIVETLFDWPGLGAMTVDAALNRDRPLLAAIVMVSAIGVVTANAVGDALLWAADPRVRTEISRGSP